MTPMFGGYGVSEPGQITQAPVSPMARALNNLAAAMLYKRDIEQANREREQQKQQFEMQQKLQQEQLKAAQQQQKLMEQEEKRQQQAFDWRKEAYNTSFGELATLAGISPDLLPEGLADQPSGKYPGLSEALVSNFAHKVDPETAMNWMVKATEMAMKGAPLDSLLSLAGKSNGMLAPEDMQLMWEGAQMTPERFSEITTMASKFQQDNLPMLNAKADHLLALQEKVKKEKDPTKKANMEGEIEAIKKELSGYADAFTSQYKGTKMENTARSVVEGMIFDPSNIANYPALTAALQIEGAVYMAKHMPRGGGGRRGGGVPTGANNGFKFNLKDMLNLQRGMDIAAQAGDVNLFNAYWNGAQSLFGLQDSFSTNYVLQNGNYVNNKTGEVWTAEQINTMMTNRMNQYIAGGQDKPKASDIGGAPPVNPFETTPAS